MNCDTRDNIVRQVRLHEISQFGYQFGLHSNGDEQGVVIYRAGELYDFPVSSDNGFGLYQYLRSFVRRIKRNAEQQP
jgi:hypothetical protein